MEKQFVTYEIAKKLKELGFDEPCLAWYCNNMNILYANLYNGNPIEGNNPPMPKQIDYYAPLWQQVYEWIYEKHNLVFNFQYKHKGGYDLEKMEKEILSALKYINNQEALKEAGLI